MKPTQPLVHAIRTLAAATHQFTESLLGSETWAWGEYVEVRYAFLGAYLELRDLAAQLLAERSMAGQAPSEAQRALAQHQAAFRDVEALLVGVPPELVPTPPAVGEWPIKVIVTHIHEVERYFFATILNALREPAPTRLRGPAVAALLGEPETLDDQLPFPLLWADFERLHERVVSELAPSSETELAIIAPMWESTPTPIRFRLHRFDAHLREHANQLEKTLHALQHPPNEAKLLIRQLYAALAEVEGALIGAAGLGEARCAALAKTLAECTASVLVAAERTQAMVEATLAADLPAVERLLAADPRLAAARADDGLSVLLKAIYNGQPAITQALAAARRELTLFEAAAIGNVDEIAAWVQYAPEQLNIYASDGFTALQLAAYFGHEEAVRSLLAAGADVHAVAKNKMQIQPIHAAVANASLPLVEILLQAGANPNAQQKDGYTPLMAARQQGNLALVGLLHRYGAVD